MNKKLFIIGLLISSFSLFYACTDNEDEYAVSQEWKDYNAKVFRETSPSFNPAFKDLSSISNNGSVHFREIDDFIPNTQSLKQPKITTEGTPYFTDSVSIRYEGFFYLLDGSKYIFDTTEGDNNSKVYNTRVNNLIDGMTTMLQYMTIDEQVEVCIPYRLGYKETGTGTAGTSSYIPGYTTLWFKIKLMNIYDDQKKEWIKK